MNVKETRQIEADWKLEIGGSTWNPNYVSIRSRHIHRGNRFSPRSSPEIPSGEIPEIIRMIMQSGNIPDSLKKEIRLAVG